MPKDENVIQQLKDWGKFLDYSVDSVDDLAGLAHMTKIYDKKAFFLILEYQAKMLTRVMAEFDLTVSAKDDDEG